MNAAQGHPDTLKVSYGFRNGKSVLKLNTEVSDGTVHLGMPQEQLHYTKVTATLDVYVRESHDRAEITSLIKEDIQAIEA